MINYSFMTTPAIQYYSEVKTMSIIDVLYKSQGISGPIIWVGLHLLTIGGLIWIRLKMLKEGD